MTAVRLETQTAHEPVDVGGHGLLVVSGRLERGASDAAQVRRDGGVLRGEPAHDVTPGVPGLGKPCSSTTAGPCPPIT
jgi:hypothetical protein